MKEHLVYPEVYEEKKSAIAVDEAFKEIEVEISQRPLSAAEKALLAPDLKRRGLNPEILDILPPKGDVFYLFRALSPEGHLLGITVALNVFPFTAAKVMMGEGNHIGWDISFYFAPKSGGRCVEDQTSRTSSLFFELVVSFLSQLSSR